MAALHGRSGQTLVFPPLPSRDQGVRDGTKESGGFLHVQSGVSGLLVSYLGFR